MTIAPTIQQLQQMSVSERLRLIEHVWSLLADQPGALAVPQWHRDELDARLDAHRGDPSSALDWSQVKAEFAGQTRK